MSNPSNQTEFTQKDIESYHWVKFNGQNGEVLYALSGVILVNMKGDSNIFLPLRVTCKIDIPELPAGQGFYVFYHTPFASLNSIYNPGEAVNGGHAVNNFDLVSVHPSGNYGSKDITLALMLGVSDFDATLYRVGFNVILTGVYRPIPPVDPCQAEVDELKRLETLCSGIDKEIHDHKGTFNPKGSPDEKASYKQTLDRLTKIKETCPTNLAAARNALNVCRLTVVPGTGPVVSVVPSIPTPPNPK